MKAGNHRMALPVVFSVKPSLISQPVYSVSVFCNEGDTFFTVQRVAFQVQSVNRGELMSTFEPISCKKLS